MRILDPNLNIEDFKTRLFTASPRVLILDYDGTLAPFRQERDKAFPYPGTRKILERIISEGGTRVVIVTGRSVDDVIPLLRLEKLPEIWGVHGRERLGPEGAYHLIPVSKEADLCLEAIRRWALDMGLDERCEVKPGSVAIHVRGMASQEARRILDQARAAWDEKALVCGIMSHRFDGGLEYRAEGCHKGQAVDTILDEAGNEAVAAYLGDDRTDEDAFRAIRRRGGLGVLVRGEPRATEASVWIRPPEELIEFLEMWIATRSGR